MLFFFFFFFSSYRYYCRCCVLRGVLHAVPVVSLSACIVVRAIMIAGTDRNAVVKNDVETAASAGTCTSNVARPRIDVRGTAAGERKRNRDRAGEREMMEKRQVRWTARVRPRRGNTHSRTGGRRGGLVRAARGEGLESSTATERVRPRSARREHSPGGGRKRGRMKNPTPAPPPSTHTHTPPRYSTDGRSRLRSRSASVLPRGQQSFVLVQAREKPPVTATGDASTISGPVHTCVITTLVRRYNIPPVLHPTHLSDDWLRAVARDPFNGGAQQCTIAVVSGDAFQTVFDCFPNAPSPPPPIEHSTRASVPATLTVHHHTVEAETTALDGTRSSVERSGKP